MSNLQLCSSPSTYLKTSVFTNTKVLYGRKNCEFHFIFVGFKDGASLLTIDVECETITHKVFHSLTHEICQPVHTDFLTLLTRIHTDSFYH